MESDPIGLFGGINTYAYVGANPAANFDPAGALGRGLSFRQPRHDQHTRHVLRPWGNSAAHSAMEQCHSANLVGDFRQVCAAGDQNMCEVFQMLGGEIDVPGT